MPQQIGPHTCQLSGRVYFYFSWGPPSALKLLGSSILGLGGDQQLQMALQGRGNAPLTAEKDLAKSTPLFFQGRLFHQLQKPEPGASAGLWGYKLDVLASRLHKDLGELWAV